MRNWLIVFPLVGLLVLGQGLPTGAAKKPTPTPGPTATPAPKQTYTPAPSVTPTLVVPTETAAAPTPTGTPAVSVVPYPAAPACATHDFNEWHGLWNSMAGCHYDHEHGEDPAGVTFTDFDWRAFLGGVSIGHPHMTGPAENTLKHGGLKWQIQNDTPRGCFLGFESAEVGVDAAAIQYHAFGDYSIEFEGRVHSTVAMLRQCLPGSGDYGYIFTIQHQDYGQRVVPYQGSVLAYPDNPPAYSAGLGPYFTLDCFGTGLAGCRPSVAFVRDRKINANSIWTSKGGHTGGQTLFNLLFRVRDTYQLLDSSDLSYPYTFATICIECGYNNSTTRVHEIAGEIPAAWDGAAWDTDPRPGRVTGETTLGGFPVKLVGAYVGLYGTQLIADKVSQFSPEAQPERDIYFNGVPSGWIGANN